MCEECGYSDRSVQMAGLIQEKGINYKLNVLNATVRYVSHLLNSYVLSFKI